MRQAPSVVEVQFGELLKLVENYRDKSCDVIRERARTQAAEIVIQGRRDGRAKMRTAIKRERTQAQEKITSTRAHFLTKRRQRQQQSDKILVEQGWEKLIETLMERWRDTDQRRSWIKALVLQGLALLPVGGWRVATPPGWDPDELLHLGGEIAALPLAPSPIFAEDAGIAAGLRIETDGVCLDGTLAGLLTNRAAIEAQLLAEVARTNSQS